MKTNSINKQQITRREFIKASSAISVGIALTQYDTFAEHPKNEIRGTIGDLRMRKLGRTGLDVTELSYGGIDLGNSALLDAVIDRGINMLHTCQGYANGNSIRAFGKVMKTKRQKVFIALKESPVSREVERALKKLNTDYVDILLPPMHDLESLNKSDLPQAFDKLKREGKIRFSGFACHKNEQTVMMKAIEMGFFDVMLVRYNLYNRKDLDPILALAKEKQNMGFMAMKVTKQLARRKRSEIPAAIKEVIKNRNVDTLLIGMSNFDELNTNLASLFGQ